MNIVFYDMEYTRQHYNATSISIGLVDMHTDDKFYAEFVDYDRSQVDEWLIKNVLNLLVLEEEPENFVSVARNFVNMKGSRHFVMHHEKGLVNWLKDKTSPITLASFGNHYDWVLFRDLFKSTGIEFPQSITNWPIDLASLYIAKGYDPNIDPFFKERFIDSETSAKHNAIFDAEVAKKFYNKLIS